MKTALEILLIALVYVLFYAVCYLIGYVIGVATFKALHRNRSFTRWAYGD